jgi:hypothetical protein
MCRVTSVQIFNSYNGIVIGDAAPAQYLRFENCTVEPSGGTALKIRTASNISFYNFYVEATNDCGNIGTWIDIDGANDVDFYSFSCELTGTHTLTTDQYFLIKDSKGVDFYSTRIRHDINSSKVFFNLESSTPINNLGAHFDGLYFITDQNNMTLFKVEGAANTYGVTLNNITTSISGTSPVGINQTTAGYLLKISNWTDGNVSCSHVVDSVYSVIENVIGDIAITSRSNQTLINCGGTISGSGAATANRISDEGMWSDSVLLTDGVTAPSTVSGRAQIYVDTADGDLKVKFGDGTVKTIVVDT